MQESPARLHRCSTNNRFLRKHPLSCSILGSAGKHWLHTGIEDNHTIAQECETSAFLSAKVQGKDAQEADDAAQCLSPRHPVALEEDAGKDNHREDAHRIEYRRTCSSIMRESEIEESIMKGGVGGVHRGEGTRHSLEQLSS